MAIRMRKGLKEQFIPAKLLPGEFAVATDTGNAWYCYTAGQVKLMATSEDIDSLRQESGSYQEAQQLVIDRIEQSIAANTAKTSANQTAIEKNSQDISGLQSGLLATNTELTKMKEEVLGQIDQDLSAVETKVTKNTQDIAKNAQDIQTLTESVAQNTGDITDLKAGAGKYPIASEAEAIAGTANDKLMSPLRTKQYVVEKMKDAVTYPIATEQEARAGIDDNKLMTPLKVAQAIEEMASGGGGGGGTIPIMSSTFSGGSFAAGTEIEIRYRWSSPNEGYGTLHLLLNNTEIITEEVQQGLNRVVVPGQVKGNYTVLMYVTDRGGLTTDKLTFTLKVGGLDITSTFDDSQDFTIKSVIRIPVTIDTISLDPIYINTTIDSSVTRSSGQQGYNIVQLPTLTAGAHKVSIQAESGTYVSNVLQYNIVIEDADTLTIVCDYDVEQVSYRDLVEIPYRVSLKGVDKFAATYKVDGETVKTLEIKSGTNIWSTRDLPVGDHVLRIEVATMDGAKTAYVEKSLRVNASSYTPLQPVTDASLLCWFDSTGRTNQDTDRNTWPDKSGNGTTARLVDFNFGANNGWIDNTLKCNGGSYVEIDLQALKDNAPYGLTVDVKFKTRDSGDELDCVLDMRGSDSNSRGCAVDTKSMYLNSGTTKVKSAVLEEEISRATFVIDRQNKLAKVYNNAVLTEAFIIQSSEDFTSNSKIYLNARLANVSGVWGPAYFGDCEIYSIRVYERALESDEIVQNHIADIPDLAEQEEKYRLNYENMMPTMYFYGDTSAMTKDNKVPLRIRYISTDSNKYGESFDLPACQVGWQGTSSLQYAVKNYKIKLKDQDGAKYKYSPFPNGILEDTFCLKADYMESSHANNTGMARFINDCLYDSKVPPQVSNPNVRTTIDGFPIQLYIAQNNDATPVYMGVFNFNLDKGCNDSFGFDENTISFEVASNSDTSAGAFKDDSDASMRQDFELRYPDEDDCTPEQVDAAYASMKRAVTWVKNSTEETFRAEVEQYFNLEYLLKYYLQVHLFGMVDNLGKNMMLTTWDGLVWYPQFYDMDTQLGLDNTGYLEFLSDIDVVAGVYNTSGSKLWTMVSTVFADELAEKYKAMRGSTYTIDNILKYWYGDQVAKIGEKQYNADMEAKYIQFKSDYLFMLHGRRYEHMRRWITERLLYLDTIYGYEADTSQTITLRANKSGSVSLTIYTYSPQYLTVRWRNGVEVRQKVGRDDNGNMTGKVFLGTLATATDQEIIITNAKHIKRIDGLEKLKPSVLNFVEAKKMVEVKCSAVTELTDVRLASDNKFLRVLYLPNCTNFGTASGGGNTLDLSSIYNMRELSVNYTALENVVFPTDGSNYTSIYFPTSIKQIHVENMPMLTTMSIPDATMTMVKIINCPKLTNQVTSLTIKAETVWIENSYENLGDFKIGNTSIDLNTIVLKDIPTLADKQVQIIGKYSSNVPNVSRLEVSCPIRELVLKKIGFTEPTILDLSGLENGSLVLEDCANVQTLIVPQKLNGLCVSKTFLTSSSSNTTFDDALKVCNIQVAGKETADGIDFRGKTITDYLRLDTVNELGKIYFDLDFSQGGYKGYVLDSYSIGSIVRLGINSRALAGTIKYGNAAVNPFISSLKAQITDDCFSELVMDTSTSIRFYGMFNGFESLTQVPDIDTSKGEDFSSMFKGCSNLISANLDVSNGTNFKEMFSECSSLEEIGPLNTVNGLEFNSMFFRNGKLLKIGGIDLTNRAYDGTKLFGYGTYIITDIIFNGSITKNSGDYDFQYLTDLNTATVESMIAALVDYTGGTAAKLTLKRVLVNRLTEAQTAAITAKNWTITAVS